MLKRNEITQVSFVLGFIHLLRTLANTAPIRIKAGLINVAASPWATAATPVAGRAKMIAVAGAVPL